MTYYINGLSAIKADENGSGYILTTLINDENVSYGIEVVESSYLKDEIVNNGYNEVDYNGFTDFISQKIGAYWEAATSE